MSRVKLQKPTTPDGKPVYLMATGFGDLTGEVAVGLVVRHTARALRLKLRDPETGEHFEEEYSVKTGYRMGDAGKQNGWCINLKDLDYYIPKEDPSKGILPTESIKLLHKEELPLGAEQLVLEVWVAGTQKYLKAYRVVAKGRKTRQQPALVSFGKLMGILFDFSEER